MGFSGVNTSTSNNERLRSRVKNRVALGGKFSFHAHPPSKESKMEQDRMDHRMYSANRVRQEKVWMTYLLYLFILTVIVWAVLTTLF